MSERNQFRVWHAAAFLAGVTVFSLVSIPSGGRRYYAELRKPKSAPPAWIFPPVWTVLNVLQLWADLRILNRLVGPERYRVIGLRALNWVLYAMFTPPFSAPRVP